MVNVNLLPTDEFEKKALGKFLKWSLSYGRYIIISVELVVFLVFFSRFVYDQRLADINDRVGQKYAIVVSAAEFESRIRSIQKRIEDIKMLDQDRTIYLNVLSRLEQITPAEVAYTTLSFNKETVSLEGKAATNESFAKFITLLKTDDKFSNITLLNVGKKETGEQTKTTENLIEFSLSMTIDGYPLVTPTPAAGAITSEPDGD